MTMSARLAAVPTERRRSYQFQALFPAPGTDADAVCAPATLDLGDGRVLDLGMVCAPTPETWSSQHKLVLAEHSYAGDGPYTAVLTWGHVSAAVIVPRPAPDLGALDGYPEIVFFRVFSPPNRPLEMVIELQLSDLPDEHQVRVDAGAGNVHLWSPQTEGEQGAGFRGEWSFTYAKPGPYRIFADLLDADGFWVTTLGEFPFEVAQPDDAPEPGAAAKPSDAAWGPVTQPVELAQTDPSLPPWLPFRYVRPLWSGARTYTLPGGSIISRYLVLGTFLAVRQEVYAGSQLWYQTGGYDWIPASSVALVQVSDLRGVELGSSTQPPPPPPPPDETRHGVVTARTLNVRSGPGIIYSIVDRLTYNTKVVIHEEAEVAGATWYRIGAGRWVHGGWIRLVDAPPEPPPSTDRQGIVVADALNVRARPGVSTDNPPVDRLLRGARVLIYEEAVSNGATWYRIGINRWVHGGWIRLVTGGEENVSIVLYAAMTLPVGWVVTSTINVRARPGISTDNPVIDVVHHNQVLSILESATAGGQKWYRIGADRWVYGPSVGVAKLRARPSAIRSDERWVGVNLREQTVVAYEGDKPVYAALAATGLSRTPTVQGVFRTWWRLRSRKMAGGSAATGGYYYLEEVPWTCYFYSGYALHAAYWHDAFGRPRSHGCVNLSPYDAWWIFQWSEPGGPNSPAVYVYWE